MSPPPQPEALIAIMGQTGSGKTTFINLATQSDLSIGNGLESCTSIVQTATPFELDGRQVLLVDTPGFDDTYKSDTEILRMIALFLSNTYENGKKLAGVIYFHRISDFRVGGIAKQNFKMFRDLCGDKTLRNVIVATNMWGEVEEKKGLDREQELKSKDAFFKPALEKGAKMRRHGNTVESAHGIIREILQNHPLPLRIQEELVDEKKDLSDTAAGATLSREMQQMAAMHRKEIEKMKAELQEAIKARDEETKRELQEERSRRQEMMERLLEQSKEMNAQYRADRDKLESLMKEMGENARRDAERTAELHEQQMDMLSDQMTKIRPMPPPEPPKMGWFAKLGNLIDDIFS